jgi:hypothetical protein
VFPSLPPELAGATPPADAHWTFDRVYFWDFVGANRSDFLAGAYTTADLLGLGPLHVTATRSVFIGP